MPLPALAGAQYDNAAVQLPGQLSMLMEAALGDAGSRWSMVAASRGASLVMLISKQTADDPPAYRVVEAWDLGSVCPGLVLETLTCDVDDKPDLFAIGLMDEQYACGGHGRSSPALAWRVDRGRLQAIDPQRVTCGSVSCEVDR